VAVLIGQLQEAYTARQQGLSPAPDTTAETRLRGWFTHLVSLDASRPEALEVWEKELAGAEPVLLLESLPKPAAQEPGGKPHARSIHTFETAALEHAARAQGVTPSTLLHAAWALTVGAITGNRDVLIGSTVSGRDAPVDGIGDAVGLFVNTLPVRMSWAPGEPLSAPLRRLQDGRTAVLDHPQVRLADLQRNRGEQFDSWSRITRPPRPAPRSRCGTSRSGMPSTIRSPW
jgi:hypothetical protein